MPFSRARLIPAAHLILGVTLAVVRIAGHKSPAFQAIAHLYVGVLLGGWIGSGYEDRACLWLAVALSAVELACFVAERI